MTSDPATRPATAVELLAARLADDLLTLDKELDEIDLLVSQAKTESGRHETRRAAAAEKFEVLPPTAPDRAEQAANLITLTKRSALMDTQVEVLDGKRRAIARYRDAVAGYIASLDGTDLSATDEPDPDAPMPPEVARQIMGAQEDLRREIAREMHDGPAQSLTNIVLQAQIVERLMGSDPERAGKEVEHLVAMVQQTLEATKTFIFDVRPMVLDDLGLVPTLRRATRERSRRADIPVEFESMGQDRRLAMDLESGLFRMLDEGLAGYLAGSPDAVSLKLDWGDRLTADLVATRAIPAVDQSSEVEIPSVEAGQSMPPALAALVEERRVAQRAAAEAAIRASVVPLPPAAWREIQDRASSVGVDASLLDAGTHLHLSIDLPSLDEDGNDVR